MKKLLLSLAMALGMSAFATAETYTITPDMTTFTEGTYQLDDKEKGTLTGSWTVDNVTFPVVIYQNTSTTAVTGIKGKNNQLRWYKSMIMTIDAPTGTKITEIQLVFGSSNKAKTFESNCGGTVTAATATTKGLKATWSDPNGVEQFKGTSNEGQIRADQIIITCSGSATPDTRKEAGLSFPKEKYVVTMGDVFTAPELTKATTAAVTYTSDKETVATVDATTGAVTIVGIGTARITAAAEANDEFLSGSASYLLEVQKNLTDAPTFTLATTFGEGTYVIEVNDEVAQALGADATHGYLYTEECLMAEDKSTLKADAANAFTFTAVEGGYNIQDAQGRYYFLSGNYNSFNIATEIPADAAAVFTVTIGEDNKATIYNAEKDKTLAYSLQYKSFGIYPDVTDATKYTLPTLYKDMTQTGVAEIETAENAPVEYFNLQGVRVANPENGLYIRRQGNKVSKVIVK